MNLFAVKAVITDYTVLRRVLLFPFLCVLISLLSRRRRYGDAQSAPLVVTPGF